MSHGSCCQDSRFHFVLLDLVPLFPWIIGRGHCRYCGTRIPAAIPIIEVTTVVFAIAMAMLVPNDALAIAGCVLGWLVALLVVADLRHQLLPDKLTSMLLASGLLASLVLPTPSFVEALFGAAIGSGTFFALRALYLRYRGFEGLGLGDVKLMAGLGAWLGPTWLPLLVLISATAGLTVVFLQSWRNGIMVSRSSRVAFGAYLCGAALLLWFLRAAFGPDL